MTIEKVTTRVHLNFFHLLLTTKAVLLIHTYRIAQSHDENRVSLALSMLRSECYIMALLKTESFFLGLWKDTRRVLLIRSVLFLSINPSELERKVVLRAFSLAARASFVYPQAGALDSTHHELRNSQRQQFIIIIYYMTVQRFWCNWHLSVCSFSNSFPPRSSALVLWEKCNNKTQRRDYRIVLRCAERSWNQFTMLAADALAKAANLSWVSRYLSNTLVSNNNSARRGTCTHTFLIVAHPADARALSFAYRTSLYCRTSPRTLALMK